MRCNIHGQLECDSCRENREHVPANLERTTKNPDFCRYDLCDECRAEYDSREYESRDKDADSDPDGTYWE